MGGREALLPNLSPQGPGPLTSSLSLQRNFSGSVQTLKSLSPQPLRKAALCPPPPGRRYPQGDQDREDELTEDRGHPEGLRTGHGDRTNLLAETQFRHEVL